MLVTTLVVATCAFVALDAAALAQTRRERILMTCPIIAVIALLAILWVCKLHGLL